MERKEYVSPVTEIIDIEIGQLLSASDLNSDLTGDEADEDAKVRE